MDNEQANYFYSQEKKFILDWVGQWVGGWIPPFDAYKMVLHFWFLQRQDMAKLRDQDYG